MQNIYLEMRNFSFSPVVVFVVVFFASPAWFSFFVAVKHRKKNSVKLCNFKLHYVYMPDFKC